MPYFLPLPALIVVAIHGLLAALRSVDVRVMVPENTDYKTAQLAAWSLFGEVLFGEVLFGEVLFGEVLFGEVLFGEVLQSGCRIFPYQRGFLHQKAVLVDDDLALFGTMNLDNRSMRLNFEVGILVENETFATRVSNMLEEDLWHCRELRPSDLKRTTLQNTALNPGLSSGEGCDQTRRVPPNRVVRFGVGQPSSLPPMLNA